MQALTPAAWMLLLVPAAVLAWCLLQSFGAYAVLAAERGTPVRLRASSVAAWAREGTVRALLTLLAPLGWGQPGPRSRGEETGREPVLLLMDYKQRRIAGVTRT